MLKPLIVALVISLGIVTFAIFPFLSKTASLYFTMDPDPMYVGNALELLQTGRVTFIDHPGTPLISLMALSYLPIKTYVNLFLHIPNFAVYFLEHLDLIYLYSRILSLSVVFIGLFLFHFVIYKNYKSIPANVFFSTLLFLDPMHSGMYWAITPEVLAFTLTAFWFYFLHKYKETSLLKFVFLASFFTGIIFATKMSFLFVILANVIFLLFEFGGSIGKFMKNWVSIFVRSLLFMGAGFFLGIVPLWYKLDSVINYILNFVTHTGKMGMGSVGIVNKDIFLSSLSTWFGQPFILIAFLVFLISITLSLKKETIVRSVLVASVIGIFAFMRYADFHYQTANILLFALGTSIFLAKLPTIYKLFILGIVLIYLNNLVGPYLEGRRQMATKGYNLQTYIDNKQVQGKIVWEYAAARDFSALRSDDWSGFTLLDDYNIAFPDTMSLDYKDLSKIANFPYKASSPLNSTCWDMLILQNLSWNNFIKAQKDPQMFVKESIPGTEMLSITYKNHLNCNVKADKRK